MKVSLAETCAARGGTVVSSISRYADAKGVIFNNLLRVPAGVGSDYVAIRVAETTDHHSAVRVPNPAVNSDHEL